MKQFLLLFLGTVFYSSLSAQSIKPVAITSSGASLTQGGAQVGFTVGEIVVKTITDGSTSIGQGVITAGSTSIITAIIAPKASLLQINVYPNPASSLFFIELSENQLSFVQLSVYSVNGALVSKETYAGGNNRIGVNMQNWPSGQYMLTFNSLQGELLASYKIVKD